MGAKYKVVNVKDYNEKTGVGYCNLSDANGNLSIQTFDAVKGAQASGSVEIVPNRLKCIDRRKDKSGNVTDYLLVNENGTQGVFKAAPLKIAIRNGWFDVINLTLTSDDRLVLSEGGEAIAEVLKEEKPVANQSFRNMNLIELSRYLAKHRDTFYAYLKENAGDFSSNAYIIELRRMNFRCTCLADSEDMLALFRTGFKPTWDTNVAGGYEVPVMLSKPVASRDEGRSGDKVNAFEGARYVPFKSDVNHRVDEERKELYTSLIQSVLSIRESETIFEPLKRTVSSQSRTATLTISRYGYNTVQKALWVKVEVNGFNATGELDYEKRIRKGHFGETSYLVGLGFRQGVPFCEMNNVDNTLFTTLDGNFHTSVLMQGLVSSEGKIVYCQSIILALLADFFVKCEKGYYSKKEWCEELEVKKFAQRVPEVQMEHHETFVKNLSFPMKNVKVANGYFKMGHAGFLKGLLDSYNDDADGLYASREDEYSGIMGTDNVALFNKFLDEKISALDSKDIPHAVHKMTAKVEGEVCARRYYLVVPNLRKNPTKVLFVEFFYGKRMIKRGNDNVLRPSHILSAYLWVAKNQQDIARCTGKADDTVEYSMPYKYGFYELDLDRSIIGSVSCMMDTIFNYISNFSSTGVDPLEAAVPFEAECKQMIEDMSGRGKDDGGEAKLNVLGRSTTAYTKGIGRAFYRLVKASADRNEVVSLGDTNDADALVQNYWRRFKEAMENADLPANAIFESQGYTSGVVMAVPDDESSMLYLGVSCGAKGDKDPQLQGKAYAVLTGCVLKGELLNEFLEVSETANQSADFSVLDGMYGKIEPIMKPLLQFELTPSDSTIPALVEVTKKFVNEYLEGYEDFWVSVV